VDDDPRGMVVSVSGEAGAVERAFGVQLNHYTAPDGRRYRSSEGEPSIPSNVAPHLRMVLGLSDLSGVLRRHGRPAPALHSKAITGTGALGGLSPIDIRTIYGLTSTPLTGAGQTVAIFELDGYSASDINTYATTFGLPAPSLTFIGVDGTTNHAGSATAEVCGDIEMVMSVTGSGLAIKVYDGPNTSQGVYDIYNRIATDNSASAISTSWGAFELNWSSTFLNNESQVFQRLATQGQSIFAASGDSGAYDDGSTISVDDPASQPYVTGVGGTSLSGTVANATETTWNGGSIAAGASGGGVSTVWSIPSYQNGVAGKSSTTMRNVPDVALNADPNSGVSIYFSGGWHVYGGTSFAAPIWAGFTALINQERAAGSLPPLGFANAALYPLGTGGTYGSLFRDITSGNNLFYSAGTGYDNATGWGSFRGAAMLAQFAPRPPNHPLGLRLR
jgi:kumamolisin